jgi:hypothetical protein
MPLLLAVGGDSKRMDRWSRVLLTIAGPTTTTLMQEHNARPGMFPHGMPSWLQKQKLQSCLTYENQGRSTTASLFERPTARVGKMAP